MELRIRDEMAGDESRIHDLTRIAFQDKAFSNKNEHLIIDTLRLRGALAVSLVAVNGKELVGHVAFSTVSVSQAVGPWYVLGPISVLPEKQRQGVGSGLIREGLARIAALGANGCVVVGNPEYYTRFGFSHESSLILNSMPPEVSLALRLRPNHDAGLVTFHAAFSHP